MRWLKIRQHAVERGSSRTEIEALIQRFCDELERVEEAIESVLS